MLEGCISGYQGTDLYGKERKVLCHWSASRSPCTQQPWVQRQIGRRTQPGSMHCKSTAFHSQSVQTDSCHDACQPGKASAMACATAELSLMLAMMRPPGLNRCPSCFHTSTYTAGNRVGNRVATTYREIGNTVGNTTGSAYVHCKIDCSLSINTMTCAT